MIAFVAAATASAFGQTPASPAPQWPATDPSLTIVQRIELGRPKMAPRQLTAAEKNEVKRIKAARPATDALIAQMRPYAEAGDKDALDWIMRQLVSRDLRFGSPGYPAAVSAEEKDKETAIATAWRGTFAVGWWRLHGPDVDAANAIRSCMVTPEREVIPGKPQRVRNFPGRTNMDCGIELSMRDDGRSINAYVLNKGQPPQDVVFTEYSLAQDGPATVSRYNQILTDLNQGKVIYGWEATWAQDQARVIGREKEVQDARKRNIDMRDAAYVARLNRKDARTEEQKWRDDWSIYCCLDAVRMLWLEERAESLGDKTLLEFAARHMLTYDKSVEHLCRIDKPMCQAQVAARERARIETEQQAMLSRLTSSDIVGGRGGAGSMVTVRNYDAQGNYLGNTTTTAAFADLLTRN